MGKLPRLHRRKINDFIGMLNTDSQLEERSRDREFSDKIIFSLAGETK
ncbi:hypothetical protein [Xenorhabdus lircayensis]|uniref:Uncharacterized protein n=1 Tax=Xenorhabdus lircayensis TaxID=2763499 RepID=A0ABS0U3H3_9GAMM|nr:hypothetical protein [Xenorhabdus lircayensis]MBI6548440.1 hypothetical protein [Xenorhabdus lircayensis]